MESLSSTSSVNPLENNGGNKADCYFYYYSSCNKGNACPFRHEPTALRNETMCVYWLKGSCNKPHCIYRHMEIKKNRNKIPCFFESQPGGCKKLHCPFFHNNVLDQPREEDVPNNPDLILPVKDSEFQYETEESEFKKLQESVASQLKLHRKMSDSQNSIHKDKEKETSSNVPIPSNVRRSIIVPLQDGESDSESVTVTPVNPSKPNRRCIFTNEWELEKLKEIQREERNLLGFPFYDEEEDLSMSFSESPFSQVIEETEEYDLENDPSSYTFIRKSFESKPLSSQQVGLSRENFGGLAKRVIGEALLGNRIDRNHAKNIPQNSFDSEVDSNHVGGRIRLKETPKKKISAKERLGRRSSQSSREKDDDNRKVEAIKSRPGLQEGNVKRRLNLSENKSDINSSKNGHSDFVIKSLAEIRAERNKEKSNSNGSLKKNFSSEVLPLSAYINNSTKNSKDLSNNTMAVEEIKVKTLDEIKAEKKSKVTHNGSKQKLARTNSSVKRSYSPISFGNDHQKKLKSATDTENVNLKPVLNNFQSRKLLIKKLPTKSLRISSTKTESTNSAQLEKRNNATKVSNKVTKSNLNNHEVTNKQNCTNNKLEKSSENSTKEDTLKRRESTENSSKNHRLHTSRLDSFVDEEELLLLDDSGNVNIDVDDIDEDELLS
ncbi:UNVERIFIED_CONTAM: hypothetical protein RMT77_004985 [Armadillidium vulgare]